jgi:hypothetical protein
VQHRSRQNHGGSSETGWWCSRTTGCMHSNDWRCASETRPWSTSCR